MQKPQLSVAGLVNMSVANLGTAVAFSLQQGNMARIFQTLGAELDKLPILMIAGPVTGLIVQPLVGYFSDRRWGRLGRRRPFILAGAILASLALLGMPYAQTLLAAVLMLWLLDAALNVAIEPFRALVAEVSPATQLTTALSFNAAIGCVGAILGFILPFALSALDLANTAPAGQVPQSVQFALLLAAAVLVAAVGWTVLTTREYSPAELAAFGQGNEKKTETIVRPRTGALWLAAGLILSLPIAVFALDIQLYIISLGIAGIGAVQLLNRLYPSDGVAARILSDLATMPSAMRRLAVIHALTWFALFIMWPFMTPVVTQYAFGATDPSSRAYNEGADWVGVLFAGFNISAVIFSFLFLPRMARLIGTTRTHAICLAVGAASFASLLSVNDRNLLFLPFAGLGIAWASLLSLPYTMLTNAVPREKLGTYIGLFNMFIVTPQIVVAAAIGPVLRAWFPGEPIWTMLIAAGAMALAALLTLVLKPERL